MGTMAALWVGWEPRGSPCPPALPTTPSPAPHAAPPPHPITHSTTPPPPFGALGPTTHPFHPPPAHPRSAQPPAPAPTTPTAPRPTRPRAGPHGPPGPHTPSAFAGPSPSCAPPFPTLPLLPPPPVLLPFPLLSLAAPPPFPSRSPRPPVLSVPPPPTCSPTATRWPSAHAHCRLPSAPAPPFCPRAARARRAPREGSRRHRRSGKTEVSGPAGGGWRRERGESAGKGGTAAIGRAAPPPSYLRAATAAMKRPASPLARPATNRRGEEGRCFAPLAERAVAPRRAGHASRSHVRRFAGGRHVGAGTWAAPGPPPSRSEAPSAGLSRNQREKRGPGNRL